MKKLNNIAHRVTKPQKPAKVNYEGATEYLNLNRAGIVKLRRRGFTWGQIVDTFQRLGIGINYNNLYQWQLRNFPQKKRAPKFKVGDIVKPVNSRKAGFKRAIVCEVNNMRRTMEVMVEGNKKVEVPSKLEMFKKLS